MVLSSSPACFSHFRQLFWSSEMRCLSRDAISCFLLSLICEYLIIAWDSMGGSLLIWLLMPVLQMWVLLSHPVPPFFLGWKTVTFRVWLIYPNTDVYFRMRWLMFSGIYYSSMMVREVGSHQIRSVQIPWMLKFNLHLCFPQQEYLFQEMLKLSTWHTGSMWTILYGLPSLLRRSEAVVEAQAIGSLE